MCKHVYYLYLLDLKSIGKGRKYYAVATIFSNFKNLRTCHATNKENQSCFQSFNMLKYARRAKVISTNMFSSQTVIKRALRLIQ